MKPMTRLTAFAVVAVLGTALLVPSGSTAGKKRGMPDLFTYKAMIHVAGGVDFISQRDDIKNCLPGQRWTIKESGDVDIRGNILIETYKNSQARSSSAVVPGSVTSKNTLEAYEESNYCPPDEPYVFENKPDCGSDTVKGSVGLVADARRKGPKRMSIGIGRKGGAEQDLSCTWGLGSRATPMGANIDPMGSVYSSLVLPADITIKQLRSLGVKKKLIRTVRVGGSCAEPVVYRGKKIPTDTSGMNDGDCVADGDFVITIKRLNRISKQGVPVN